jgi:hypothetical protein
LSEVPNFVLLGAESEFVADGMRISVVSPNRVDYGIHHFLDSSFADIGILQMLLDTVFEGDIV